MRQSPDPDAALLEFLQKTYEAASNCAHWTEPRSNVEVSPPAPQYSGTDAFPG